MSLSVKSYLVRNSGKTEVRRFILDEFEAKKGSLSSVWEKLNKLYAENLQEKGFALFWKDDDEDDIIMTVDEELITAIKSLKTDVLKIYVQKPKTSKKFSKQQDASDAHPGITCDGCEGGVSGMRYKCLQCPDYDLCGKCEHKSLHPEHVMIRIPLSSARNFGGAHPFFPFWMNPAFHRGRHGGCGWRRGHKFHHQKETSPQNSGQQQQQQQQQQQHTFNPADFLERVWRQLGNFVPQAGTTRSPQASDSTQEEQTFKPEDYLQSVGESVAAMLDPLGIDVLVDIEHNGERHTCSEPKNETSESKQPSSPPKSESKVPTSSSEEKMEMEQPASVESDGVAAREISPSTEGTDSNAESIKSNIQKSSAADYITNLSKALNSFAVGRSDPPSNEQTMSVDRDSPNILDTNEWTYINYQEKEQDANVTPQHTEPKKIAEEPSASATPSHPDPVIASAVDQMLSMGYDNEGNWLAVLLELNNGNIDQTLDMIVGLQQNQSSMMELVIKLMEKSNGDLTQLVANIEAIKNHL